MLGRLGRAHALAELAQQIIHRIGIQQVSNIIFHGRLEDAALQGYPGARHAGLVSWRLPSAGVGDVLGMIHEGGFTAQARGPRHLGKVIVISVGPVRRHGA